MAVGQSPALLQHHFFLWVELHVKISAISTIDMDQQRCLSQMLHRYCMKQCHRHKGTVLQKHTEMHFQTKGINGKLSRNKSIKFVTIIHLCVR